jgi:DNA-binding transcriptional regulator of glucitol operon
VNDLSALIEQMKKQQEAQQLGLQQQAAGQLAGAGIAGGTQLVGGLFAQKAAEGIRERERQMQKNEQESKLKAETAAQTAQEQQDAFTRLMGSMRSALVR